MAEPSDREPHPPERRNLPGYRREVVQAELDLVINPPERRNLPGYRRRLLQARDVDELAHALPHWNADFQQFGRGPFACELRSLDLPGVQLLRGEFNRRIRVHGSPTLAAYSFHPVTQGKRTSKPAEIWG